ncbi:PIN-like domain-containing protein [Leifsonia sp. C5G2]|uniref:PIN-like domain-containing protein n=1 Tax=Leifsonia sp. C5G2 TaxID=2735269 RepID=UPI001585AB34|nr:PIN-like domain-containing protein [Leifsonia sp. C5G2]NUU05905.1 DUF4935 domain-containing protein [Leifsonia sp. C5G2]
MQPIEVRGLTNLFAGVAVVDDLSLTIAAGEVFALGPNVRGRPEPWRPNHGDRQRPRVKLKRSGIGLQGPGDWSDKADSAHGRQSVGETPAGRGLYDGFEGYRDPTEDEVLALLETCPIILDTNVLLDIYGFEEPARVLALDVLDSIRSRLWVPHQVMREFWRNRHSVIAGISSPVQPIDAVRGELLAIVNSLRPDRERPEEIQSMRETVETQLDELAEAISKARGNPLNIAQILTDTSLDPVLARLEGVLRGRVGRPLGDDEPSLIQAGLKRFAVKIPPGYMDAEDKADQLPEQGTGDYLLWEQTLRYVSELQASSDAFVIVTNDAKEDWRINVANLKKRALGVRPELVAEALDRTGRRLVLLQQSDFYRLMSRIRPGDQAASDSLVEASALGSHDDGLTESEWTEAAYKRLLHELREAGNQVQADIVSIAAQSGGFISRAKIYEYAGYAEDRSLRRFAMPAQRVALSLVESELLSEDAPTPLEAIYEGPGKAVGYRVPREFVKYEAQRDEQPTWVRAAATVAATSPERVWTVNELVSEIRRLGIRDVSVARTPEATLRRDLSLRDGTYFEHVGSGFRLRSDVRGTLPGSDDKPPG